MRWHARALQHLGPLILGCVLGLVATVLLSPVVQANGLLPGITLLAPSAGATVSGTVTVWAAADNPGVTGLQFQVNGANLGPQITSGTCSAAWNTATVADGDYTLIAIASDDSGNTATSTPVKVTVGNAVPSISSVAVSNLQSGTATVTWTTNQASGTQMDYGTTAIYGTSTPLDSTWVTLHAQALTGLTPNTTYHFRVRSWNPQFLFGTSGDFVFTTTGGTGLPAAGCLTPDPFASLGGGTCVNGGWSPPHAPGGTAPPRISSVAILNVNTSTAALTWTTDQAADSEVDYGPTADYGISAPVDPQLVTTHNKTLTGLSAGTTYHFRVGSWNATGLAGVSQDTVFTTLSNAPPMPPATSNGPPAPSTSGGTGCATPDPFVVLGGGICSQHGWRPPIVAATTPSGGGSGTCMTPDPFVILGGGICTVGGWRPPVTVVTPASASSVGGSSSCITADPFVVLGGGICANGGWRPPPYAIGIPPMGGSGNCITTDPFVAVGGGTCVGGGWRPLTMVLITGSGTSVPVVNPALCKTPDPFASIPGLVGACINGGWVPLIKVGG